MSDFKPDRRSILKTASGVIASSTALSVVATGSGTAQSDSTAATVTYTADLLPGQKDEIELTISLSVDEGAADSLGAASWSSSPADEEHVVDAAGISAGMTAFQWDGQTTDAHVTIRYAPTGVKEISDTFAILEIDSTYGNPDLVAEQVTNGVRGDDFTLFGDHTLLTETIGGQELRLAVPDALIEDISPNQIFDLLTFCAGSHDLGPMLDRITGFGTRVIKGQQSGSELFTRFNTSTKETWAHEYHHTQQEVNPGPGMSWLKEGEADWAGQILGYRAGILEWGEVVTDTDVSDGVLLTDVDPKSDPAYDKGSLVLSYLDKRIRDYTDGNRTYWDVAERIHDPDAFDESELTVDRFIDEINAVAGTDLGPVVDAYVRDTNIPPGLLREDFDSLTAAGKHPGNERRGFEIKSLDFPEEIEENEPLYINVTVENTGFFDDTQTVKIGSREDEYAIDPDHVHGSKEISLSRGEQDRITFSRDPAMNDGPSVYRYRVKTDQNTMDGDVAIGKLTLLNSVSAPDQVEVGEPIDVDVDLRLSGYEGISVTRTIELVNESSGSVVDSVEIQTDQAPGSITLTRPGSQNSDDGAFNYVVRTADESKTGSVTIGEGTNISCFITTATANDVSTLNSLRRFRDESMSATPVGRALVWLYYRISPPIADTLERNPDSRTANATRSLVQRCADISDRQEATDSRMRSAALGVQLTLLYIVGILTGAMGHGAIRASELTDD